MSKKNYSGKKGVQQMKEEFYDYSCYHNYKKYWINRNFPFRFRKYKNKIFEQEKE